MRMSRQLQKWKWKYLSLTELRDVKALVSAFNQEKALVGAFSVITNLRMDLFEALVQSCVSRQIIAIFLIGRYFAIIEF